MPQKGAVQNGQIPAWSTRPPTKGGSPSVPNMANKVATVFVQGFDFGTTEDQVAAHLGQAGNVQEVDLFAKGGAAKVTFSTPDEANYAVESLNKTVIDGNERYIDVRLDLKSMPQKGAVQNGQIP